MFAHTPRSHRDEGDDGRVESMEELLSVWERANPIIKDRQSDHHEHRRQNKSAEGNTGAPPSAQSESNVSHRIAGTGSGQALPQSEGFDEVVFAQPASLLHDNLPDVREYRQSTAETCQANFEK